MRIEVENATSAQQTQTNQRQPQEIANHISEHIGKKRQSDTRRNLDSFRNRTNEQGISSNTHSYHNTRPSNKTTTETFVSRPLPTYPPPVRPPPPDGYTTATNRIQNNAHHSWTATNPHHIRLNNLQFPYAVTPRSNNRKSFFHQSTNEQAPHQLSWKKFGSKKRTRELLTIHTTVIIILYYRTVTGLKCHSIPVIIILL